MPLCHIINFSPYFEREREKYSAGSLQYRSKVHSGSLISQAWTKTLINKSLFIWAEN